VIEGVGRLRAEMRVPGRAWLELAAVPDESEGGSEFRQRAVFFPKGRSRAAPPAARGATMMSADGMA
jgi:hypothetical protein